MSASRFMVAAFLFVIFASTGAEPRVISRWSFEQGGANSAEGGPEARLEGASTIEGHEGQALAFQDWSTKNYLKPDPGIATRVIVPHDPRLNPESGFRATAWIYPTEDPVYYGGILEKGRGYGASYRLLLLRGLKVQASVGNQHVTVRSSSPVSLNSWHEVSFTVDGRSLSLHVDGKEAGRASLAEDTSLDSTDPLIIGERFTGRIDEIEISSQ